MDDRAHRILRGLARNRATPVDVLARLPLDQVEHRVWRTRRDMPDDLAILLVNTGDPELAAIADTLSESPDVHRRIDGHPDPNVRGARRDSVMRTLRRGDWVSPESLACLPDLAELVHDPGIRVGIAKSWPEMPDATLRVLLTDPDPEVREAAAGWRNRHAPEDMRAALLTDPAVRHFVVLYAELTPELAREFETNCADDELGLACLARNPTLPADVLDRLAANPGSLVRGSVLARQELPEDRRRALYAETDADAGVAAFLTDGLKWLRDLPTDALAAYADSPIPEFRAAVARRPELAARFDDDENWTVRRAAARRPDVPPDVLERLVTEHGPERKSGPFPLTHPNFALEAFVRLAAHPEPSRRSYALHSPDLPADVVAELAHDHAAGVRRAAAGHPRLPLPDLVVLLDDEDMDVVEAAAGNPVLPLAEMERLVVSVWSGVGDSSHEWGT
ncbi:hypothetical protein GCM10029964_033520 [Kibdelosporangium lantanae]